VECEPENSTGQAVNLTVKNLLLDASGKTVATNTANVKVAANGKQKSITTLQVNNPRLWNLKTPYLYTLKTTVTQSGNIIDETAITTGIRQFTFDPDSGMGRNRPGRRCPPRP
jgi:beta-galactosidase